MIICCGEALIDMLPRRLESGEDVFLPVSGGAIFNTAITLGRLGQDVGFLSGLSNDLFGQQLISSLHGSNVDTELCVRSDQPSTLAFVKLSDGQAQYTFIDENSAGRMLSTDALPDLPESVNAVHFGAISLIPEPCGTAYETLMQRQQEKCVISLDPNIRPSFISKPDVHRARIKRMLAMSDIVKVSDEDLAWISPDHSMEDAVSEIISGGTSIVILSKGAQGVEVHTLGGRFEVPAIEVEVMDTIGAGDSFNGGFLSGLLQSGLLEKSLLKTAGHEAIKPAAELAVKVAALTVSRSGANPPWKNELEAI